MSYSQVRLGAPEPPNDLILGMCCACGSLDGVRNLVCLPYRAPVPGTGWGCAVCDLPPDGALAVLCDACAEDGAMPVRIAFGYLAGLLRVPLDPAAERFEHDPRRHKDEDTGLWNGGPR